MRGGVYGDLDMHKGSLDLPLEGTRKKELYKAMWVRMLGSLRPYFPSHCSFCQTTLATLDTLNVYLTWVPLGYIFESNLVQLLLQLFPQPAFRNVALQCLTEVGVGRGEGGEEGG